MLHVNRQRLVDIEILITIITSIGILSYFFYAVYFLNQVSIYIENGILENTQVIVLIISMLVFFFSVFNPKREDKLILIFFSFLCFSFILREVDVETLDIPNTLKIIGHGMYRNIMIITGFIIISTYAIYHNKHLCYTKLYIFLVSINGILIMMAGILLYLGDFFEHYNSITHHVFLEEICELSGYILLLLSALLFLKNKLSLTDSIEKSTKKL